MVGYQLGAEFPGAGALMDSSQLTGKDHAAKKGAIAVKSLKNPFTVRALTQRVSVGLNKASDRNMRRRLW